MVWKILKRSAPQLVGFGVGLGSFAYIERYEVNPPEVVENNSVLLSAHNGLLAAKRGFQGLWGGEGARQAPQQDAGLLLEQAKTALDAGDLENCCEILGDVFVGTNGTMTAFSLVPHMEWLIEAAPMLHDKGHLSDLETIVVFNWLCKAGGGGQLVTSHPKKSIDLPIRILQGDDVSHTDKLLCCCLLTHATGWHAMHLPERRENKGWFSKTPRNEVVEKVMVNDTAVKALVECLMGGLRFPADFAIFSVDSDERHAKKLRDAGFLDALSTVVAQHSTLKDDEASSASKAASNTEHAGSLLHAFSSLGGVPHTSLDDDEEQSSYLQFTDAVFLLTASNPTDPEAVIYGLEALRGLLDTGKVPMPFLAEKGIVSLATQSLHHLGSSPDLVEYINAFVFPFITEPAVKEHVKDEEIQMLAQTLHALATQGVEEDELADAALQGILAPEESEDKKE